MQIPALLVTINNGGNMNTESNKLIAEFMNVIKDEEDELEYDTSWDWLMPVII